MATSSQPPLIAHVIQHLILGGLENGLINLINHIPSSRYRHAVICLSHYSDFRHRIQRDDVEIFALNKKEGKDFALYGKLFKLFLRLRPAIVHGRNLSALQALPAAKLAGVPYRIHGEHGWDMFDLPGKNHKYQRLRQLHRPFVNRYIPLSKELEYFLKHDIGVPVRKMTQIYNGVDTQRFHPTAGERKNLPIRDFATPDCLVIGTVGRMQAVKDQLNLAQAFVQLVQNTPAGRDKLRLVLIGTGPLLEEIRNCLENANMLDLAWLAGARDDIPELLRCLDVFVLPSRAEGISNTILEAMASGLPVIATRVGGNAELIVEGQTGFLAPAENSAALAQALSRYVEQPHLISSHGQAARQRAERVFSIEQMVQRYLAVYDAGPHSQPKSNPSR